MTWSILHAREMQLRTKVVLLGCSVFALSAGACLPDRPSDEGPLVDTFAVSDYYTPSGFMGDGATFRHLYLDVNQNCKQPRPANARGDCFTFTYYKDTAPTGGWAGVYWTFPANNWGTRPGHAIDTTKFHSVHYYVSIDYPPVPPELQGMGIEPDHLNVFYGIPKTVFPNADEFKVQIYPKVGSELQEFWIPFPDGNAVSPDGSWMGPFGWSISFPSYADPSIPLVIHLDDIVWDTAEPPANTSP